jgi:hypothetical protein
MKQEDYKIMCDLADNAFECSNKLTMRIAKRHDRMFKTMFVLMVLLFIMIIIK